MTHVFIYTHTGRRSAQRSWRDKVVASSNGADCIKRLEGLHGLLSRAVLKESGNAPAGNRRVSTAPSGAAKAKAGPAKAGGKAAAAGVGGKAAPSVAPVELAPKCVGALKAILAALGK